MAPMRWAVLLIVAIVLAGCTDESAPAATEDEPTSTLGTISGVTVDPTIQPIAGATVRLVPGDTQAESDLFGRFRMDAIPPGTYQLAASAPGHATTNLTVVVEAGETLRPRMVLEDIPIPVAKHETHSFEGSFQASAGPASDAGSLAMQTLGLNNCTCVFQLPAPALLAGITVEATWQDSLSGAEATEFRWNVTIDGNRSASGGGQSPMLGQIDPDDLDFTGARSIVVTLLPDADWPTYEQPFQLFVTLWEVEPATPGWSYVQGDT